MCRNIRPLYHFDPPVTPEEIHAASLQFVRKVSGFAKPSAANQPAFQTKIPLFQKWRCTTSRTWCSTSWTRW